MTGRTTEPVCWCNACVTNRRPLSWRPRTCATRRLPPEAYEGSLENLAAASKGGGTENQEAQRLRRCPRGRTVNRPDRAPSRRTGWNKSGTAPCAIKAHGLEQLVNKLLTGFLAAESRTAPRTCSAPSIHCQSRDLWTPGRRLRQLPESHWCRSRDILCCWQVRGHEWSSCRPCEPAGSL